MNKRLFSFFAGEKFVYNGEVYEKYAHGSDGRVKDSSGKVINLPTMTIVQEYVEPVKAPEPVVEVQPEDLEVEPTESLLDRIRFRDRRD